MSYVRKEDGTCGCGRSQTGDCIGWHMLTPEEYQTKTEEDKEAPTKNQQKKNSILFI